MDKQKRPWEHKKNGKGKQSLVVALVYRIIKCHNMAQQFIIQVRIFQLWRVISGLSVMNEGTVSLFHHAVVMMM